MAAQVVLLSLDRDKKRVEAAAVKLISRGLQWTFGQQSGEPAIAGVIEVGLRPLLQLVPADGAKPPVANPHETA